MGLDTHIRRGHPITFGLLIFFGIIEGSIATWLTTKFNRHHNYMDLSVRDRTRLLTFTSWWTVLFCAILLFLFMRTPSGAVASVLVHLVFLGITWILWTAGAASITAALGGGINCSRVEREVTYCNQLNALEGFAWVEWILCTFAIFVVIVCAIRSMRRGDGARGSLVVD
ncbi:membrane-associating domain protein [Ceratobasidium sp. AG-Ba]|nr:membrane-associating domain protein [Ceratobasidium sp. AG-Ba]QRW12178.1 membrane-associating domain protein [Ceratobasidium sp. AG-Ba]